MTSNMSFFYGTKKENERHREEERHIMRERGGNIKLDKSVARATLKKEKNQPHN